MSSAKLIDINQRASQCYKAAKKLKSHSSYLSSSEEILSEDELHISRAFPFFRQKPRFESFDRSRTRNSARSQGAYDHVAATCTFGRKASHQEQQFKSEQPAQKFIQKCLIWKEKTHIAVDCPLNPIDSKKGTWVCQKRVKICVNMCFNTFVTY